MQAEFNALQELKVFQPLPRGEREPQDFKKIPLLWVFTMKPDGTHKAQYVADGHMTDDPPSEDVYAAVVKTPNVRLIFSLWF